MRVPHGRILRGRTGRHRDEALCVFASTREAIRAAVELQQRFVDETLEQPDLPLTVGIGLDAGPVRLGPPRRGDLSR
jgi:class 3 adenylate cyclase